MPEAITGPTFCRVKEYPAPTDGKNKPCCARTFACATRKLAVALSISGLFFKAVTTKVLISSEP